MCTRLAVAAHSGTIAVGFGTGATGGALLCTWRSLGVRLALWTQYPLCGCKERVSDRGSNDATCAVVSCRGASGSVNAAFWCSAELFATCPVVDSSYPSMILRKPVSDHRKRDVWGHDPQALGVPQPTQARSVGES